MQNTESDGDAGGSGRARGSESAHKHNASHGDGGDVRVHAKMSARIEVGLRPAEAPRELLENEIETSGTEKENKSINKLINKYT